MCFLLDEESAPESVDSRNLPKGSTWQNSVTEDGDSCNENQNNGRLNPKRPRKRQKVLVGLQLRMIYMMLHKCSVISH